MNWKSSSSFLGLALNEGHKLENLQFICPIQRSFGEFSRIERENFQFSRSFCAKSAK
ncbi:hypothetical protein [Paenibacillus ferrarius]|uniref:hypothetical protein n=1 Tax=Paenibacillus ferrarius TaxID=1469647 RepID=UPI003D27C9FF